MINDTIIEGILAIYLEKRGLNEFKRERIQKREQNGFVQIAPLVEFLKNYTKNIEKYNGFSEFFPQVMNFLKKGRNYV